MGAEIRQHFTVVVARHDHEDRVGKRSGLGQVVRGAHDNILTEPRVRETAALLNASMEGVVRNTTQLQWQFSSLCLAILALCVHD